MQNNTPLNQSPVFIARCCGFLYLLIIVCGMAAEFGVRAQFEENVLAHSSLYRSGFFLDTVMLICDVLVAVLLFRLLRNVNTTLALAAMAMRLLQTSVLAVSLLFYIAPLAITKQSQLPLASAQQFLKLHSLGYDLGLIFFAFNCFLTARLLASTPLKNYSLSIAMFAAGSIYLIGSGIRFATPQLSAQFEVFYLLPLLSELAFCGWLLRSKTFTKLSI